MRPQPEPTQTAPGAPPATLWAAPEGSSSGGLRRGCVLVALIGALFVLGVFVYLIFLGARVAERAGTIEFGTGGTGCSVTGAATTFPASVSIRSVALPRARRRRGHDHHDDRDARRRHILVVG